MKERACVGWVNCSEPHPNPRQDDGGARCADPPYHSEADADWQRFGWGLRPRCFLALPRSCP